MRFLGVIVVAAALSLASCKMITEEDPTSEGKNPDLSGVPTGISPITARPSAAPTAAPDEEPTNDPSNEEFIPDNDNPVQRMVAKVYFLECGGATLPGSENATEAAVGCRIHLDVTPKDSAGKPTRAKGTLIWSYGGTPASYANAAVSDYTPTLTVLAPGELVALATVDGITSNTVRVTLTP